jgi:hypothetical protein
MANELVSARRAYERRLTERGTLRRRAVGLILIGACFIVIWGVNRDAFSVTVGLIGVAAGGVWRWCLA